MLKETRPERSFEMKRDLLVNDYKDLKIVSIFVEFPLPFGFLHKTILVGDSKQVLGTN